MTRAEAIIRLRAHLPALRDAGVTGLSLFGSTARDEAGPDSDIDILLDIDLEARRTFSLIDLAKIADRLGDDLRAPVHPIVSHGLKAEFRERIERYAIPVR